MELLLKRPVHCFQRTAALSPLCHQCRAYAAKTKRKDKNKTKEVKKEKVTPAVNVHPFWLDKANNFPSQPLSLQHERVEKGDGRFYTVDSDGDSYQLPSVTSILQQTRPADRVFALANWKKKLIKEHGAKGFTKITQENFKEGNSFHSAMEDLFLSQAYHASDEGVRSEPSELLKVKEQPTAAAGEDGPGEGTKGSLFKAIIQQFKQLFGYSDLKKRATSPQPTSKIEKDAIPHKQPTNNILDDDVPSVATGRTPNAEKVAKHSAKTKGFMNSAGHVISDISEVYALESVVCHQRLGYMGTVDLVAKYKGEVCVIDWKTSRKPKPEVKDLYDFPLQSVAYAGAINSDDHYPFCVSSAVIVVTYDTGEPAHVHVFDKETCMTLWTDWVDRVDKYKRMFAHDLTDVIVE